MTLYLVLLIMILLILYEIAHGIYRQCQRVRLFNQAQRRAQATDQPLIVVGDPYNGQGSKFYSLFMDNYGCGDETVDLTGAEKCPNGVQSDLLTYLKRKPDNSGVIFVSCVLEYVPHMSETVRELERVAGGFDNVFVVTVNAYTLAAWFYRGDTFSRARQIVWVNRDRSIGWKAI